MYLINEAGHVLAKKENFLADIVSGALNLSFGINPSATCLAGGDPDYDCEGGLQVLAGLSGTNVREKWLQAIYGSGTIAVKHCYQAATQAVAPCTASGSLSGARLIVVQFQVQNQSGQTVDLSFAVKAGSAFYSQYAQLALRVAPDSVQVEHIQDGAISTEKLQDGAVTDSKIQSVSSSKLSGVLDWSKLPAPLSALNACSDGQILVRNNTGGWSCSTVSASWPQSVRRDVCWGVIQRVRVLLKRSAWEVGLVFLAEFYPPQERVGLSRVWELAYLLL